MVTRVETKALINDILKLKINIYLQLNCGYKD